MKRIVCFGDSNTYGYTYGKNTGDVIRFDENTRWTGVLQRLAGMDYTIIEEGLSGRTTCFRDPLNEGMAGIDYIYPCLMSHAPFDTLIIMLGTNDCKERFAATPKNIADGVKRLVQIAKGMPVWKDVPDIIVIAPAPVKKECESSFMFGEMGKCSDKSYHLSKEYKEMAEMEKIKFLDAADVELNTIDYMHFSAKGHTQMAAMIWNELKSSDQI